jgi:hypothetical protein
VRKREREREREERKRFDGNVQVHCMRGAMRELDLIVY